MTGCDRLSLNHFQRILVYEHELVYPAFGYQFDTRLQGFSDPQYARVFGAVYYKTFGIS